MTDQTTQAAPTSEPHETFKPFTWFDGTNPQVLPAQRVMQAVEKIRDLTGGVALLVQILQREALEDEFEDGKHLFSMRDRGELYRLLVASSRIAAEETDGLVSWIQDSNPVKSGQDPHI
jgi:hypothetical protein